MNETVSLSLTPKQIQDLRQAYASSSKPSKNPYVTAELHTDGCTILIYTSGKVVFQGPEAQAVSAAFKPKTALVMAGSDEVGTGDYFGPVVVVAAYIDETLLAKLKNTVLTDSKVLSDAEIMKAGPLLAATLPHSALIVEPLKYNEIQKTHNMNAIKALLHNQAYRHLEAKLKKLPQLCVVDQFTPETLYYRYLAKEPSIVRGLTFETKAESKYPAVAAASILARYSFLKVWERMEADTGFSFPKGAGELVDAAGRRFVEQFGEEALAKVAKLHFKNTAKILGQD